jgi:hypothetical protein
MSHVLYNTPVEDGICYHCECGRFLGKITRPFTELDQKHVWDLLLAHREHARLRLSVDASIRLWSTRDRSAPYVIIDEAEAHAMNEVLIKILAEVDTKPVIHSPP